MNETQEMNGIETVDAVAESVIATIDSEAQETEALAQMHAQAEALEQRLEALSRRLDALEQASTRRVEAAAELPARKTMPAGVSTLLAKHGLGDAGLDRGSMEAGASLARVDAALTALPIEQRIAVKAELLRAGLL